VVFIKREREICDCGWALRASIRQLIHSSLPLLVVSLLLSYGLFILTVNDEKGFKIL